MKEFEPTKLVQDKTGDEIRFPKALKGMGEIQRPHAGMSMWEVDPKTLKSVKVHYKVTSLPVKRTGKSKAAVRAQIVLPQSEVHHQVVFDSNKFYCWAINADNALKKFKKKNPKK